MRARVVCVRINGLRTMAVEEPAPAEASEDALLDPLETLRRVVETVFPGRLTDGVPDDGVGAHADEDDDIATLTDDDEDEEDNVLAEADIDTTKIPDE